MSFVESWCSPDELQILVPLINQNQAEKIPGLEDLTKVYLDRVLDYMITQVINIPLHLFVSVSVVRKFHLFSFLGRLVKLNGSTRACARKDSNVFSTCSRNIICITCFPCGRHEQIFMPSTQVELCLAFFGALKISLLKKPSLWERGGGGQYSILSIWYNFRIYK